MRKSTGCALGFAGFFLMNLNFIWSNWLRAKCTCCIIGPEPDHLRELENLFSACIGKQGRPQSVEVMKDL